MKSCVYILKSQKNGRFYVGSTSNLNRRLEEHNSGKSRYTSETKPWKVVFSQEFETLSKAKKVEYWLKRQKDADFIEKVIFEGKLTKKFN